MRENIKELILGLKKIENPQMRRIRMQQIKQMQKELQQYVGDIWTG